MAHLGFDFDASRVDPREAFEPLPSGWYTAIVEDSTIKNTKNGAGQYLELTLQVVEGPAKGRKVWDRLNLWHQSDQTREIAQRTLSALARAAGVLHLSDSSALHGKLVQAKVQFVAETDRFPAKNEVKGYQGAGAAAPPAVPAPGAPAAHPPAAAPLAAPIPAARPPGGRGAPPPWANKAAAG